MKTSQIVFILANGVTEPAYINETPHDVELWKKEGWNYARFASGQKARVDKKDEGKVWKFV